MAKQTINYGTTAGDGTGENLFSAFKKAKENFDELYGAMTEFVANAAALPAAGETGKIYLALDTGLSYRWTGAAYALLSPNAVQAVTGPNGEVFQAGGVDYAALPLDANGNARGNINLRTDTLANLLALASGGGTSEIGYDPVTKALVLFNGVAGQAVASYRGRTVAMAICRTASVSTTAGSPTTYSPVPFDVTAATLDEGVLDAANPTELVIPAGANALRLMGQLKFAADSGGSLRNIRVAYRTGGTWYTSGIPLIVNSNSNGALAVYASINLLFVIPSALGTADRLRLEVSADGTGAIPVTYVNNATPLSVEFMAM